jgi:hypothetical protein
MLRVYLLGVAAVQVLALITESGIHIPDTLGLLLPPTLPGSLAVFFATCHFRYGLPSFASCSLDCLEAGYLQYPTPHSHSHVRSNEPTCLLPPSNYLVLIWRI